MTVSLRYVLQVRRQAASHELAVAARPVNSPPESTTEPRDSTVSTLPATSKPSYAE